MGAVLLFHDFARESCDPLQFTFAQLEDLVTCLRKKGFTFGSPLYASRPNQPRRVAVTIDDGFVSSVEASRLLNRYGIKPTVFVNPGETGRMNTWRKHSTFAARVLTAHELRRLACHADIGHHGWKHRSVVNLSSIRFIVENVLSLGWFRLYVGLRPRLFAYPFGEVNSERARWAARFFDMAFLVSPQGPCSNLGMPRYEVFAGRATSTISKEIGAWSRLVEGYGNNGETRGL